jgi:hypothetical protein
VALVIDEVLTREDSYALMHACDCYVSLHRSEGFGLTMAEAMLMGKPVIATGYSANMDFMDEQNSLLVNCKLVALERDVPPYGRDFRLAEPSVEHAVRHLRWVYEHREKARELGERARLDVEDRLSFEAAGRRIANGLAQIRAERAAARMSAGVPLPPPDLNFVGDGDFEADGRESSPTSRWSTRSSRSATSSSSASGWRGST